MKDTFKFKLDDSKDDTIYTATKNGSYYDISWKGGNEEAFYSDCMVEQFIKEKTWIVIKDKIHKTFTVEYYNEKLGKVCKESFTKKKNALNFINGYQSTSSIKDIKLFKTKEISLND